MQKSRKAPVIPSIATRIGLPLFQDRPALMELLAGETAGDEGFSELSQTSSIGDRIVQSSFALSLTKCESFSCIVTNE